MDLQVIHGIVPDAKLVLVNARSTTNNDGGGAFEKLGRLMEAMTDRFPGAVWSFSIGWGCDRLFTAADFAPVRAALAGALRTGTTAFNATGDLAGLECKGGQRWSAPPSPDDVGVDAVASLPEMVAVGGTKLSTDAEGDWLDEQAWYNVPLTQGTAGARRPCSVARRGRRSGWVPSCPTGGSCPTSPRCPTRSPGSGSSSNSSRPSAAAPPGGADPGRSGHPDEPEAGRRRGRAPRRSEPLLYRVAKAQKLPAFRDVNFGGNAVDQSGTAGYDMVTGLGTPTSRTW